MNLFDRITRFGMSGGLGSAGFLQFVIAQPVRETRMLYFRHLRIGKGRCTIAYYVHRRDGNAMEIVVGRAFCSPKDQFSRALGREKAIARMDHENPVLVYNEGADSRVHPSALLVGAVLPRWARRG